MSIIPASRSSLGGYNLCRQCLSRLRHQTNPASRSITAASSNQSRRTLTNISGMKADDNAQSVPRWAATPRAMRAPFRIKPGNENDEWPVNEDPEKLDQAYIRMLGPGGDNWLEEKTKWLAVTHKSFDQGRRGYNERLACIGKKKIELEVSYALLEKLSSSEDIEAMRQADAYGRTPFLDPALDGIHNVNVYEKTQIMSERRFAELGEQYGLTEVIRDLKTSGIDNILTTTINAIVGAVSLSKGGAVANQVIRERILGPLGIR